MILSRPDFSDLHRQPNFQVTGFAPKTAAFSEAAWRGPVTGMSFGFAHLPGHRLWRFMALLHFQ